MPAPAAAVGAAVGAPPRLGRGLLRAVLAVLGLLLALLLLVLAPVAVVATRNPFGGERAAAIPPVFWQMYTAAASEYKVNPYLLAAIHKVESDFGRYGGAGVRSGANGCAAAGPMQMGIVGVSPYGVSASPGCSAGPTWRTHQAAVKPIEGSRPASYPLERTTLDSCRVVPDDVGCVYDSFDAIAAAAHKLHGDGADTSLDSRGTYGAVFAYNPSHDYVSKVLGQAQEWQADGVNAPSIGLGEAVASTPPRSLARLEAVANAIDARTERGKIPYCFGGGHGSRPGRSGGTYCWHGDRRVWGSPASGLDCSGAVRLLLVASGFPDPGGISSGSYGGYLTPGPGRHLSIYYHPGHVYAVIDGRTWQTSTTNRNHGPGWTLSGWPTGYRVGHVEGI